MKHAVPPSSRVARARINLSPAALPLAIWALSATATAMAAPPRKVLIVPLGKGDAAAQTARVAREMADLLPRRHKGTRTVLAYPRGSDLPPPPLDPRAAKLVAKAHKAYQMLDFGKARQHVRAAIKLFKGHVKLGGSIDGYVKALHLLAAAELLDGHPDAAFTAMNDALLFDRAPPPKKKYGTNVFQLHGKVVRADKHIGSVRFKVSPPALLWLNGTLQGAARGTAERRAGLYLVRIGRPGLAAWVHWFRVKKGQTRELALKLKPAPNIDAAGDALRRAATRPVPGSAVAKLARAHSASEVMLLTSDASCKTNACPVALHWAVGSSWKRHSSGTFTGKPLAATLLGAAPQSTHAAAAVKTCTQNADCPLDQHCSGGMCRRKSTITRKWWFWTLIGVAVAGAVTAIVVPLTLPDNPVIEVR